MLGFDVDEMTKANPMASQTQNDFTMPKNIISKKSSKRNQNPSRYYNSIITNLKFQHKPKYHLSKILM
jgi:hypothetical protein